MNRQLREFVEVHPDGWNHDDWLALLANMERDGADVSDPAAVGTELERARLAFALERRGVRGLGPKRIAAIADRFDTLWALRHASAEDLAKIPSIPRPLAEQVLRSLE